MDLSIFSKLSIPKDERFLGVIRYLVDVKEGNRQFKEKDFIDVLLMMRTRDLKIVILRNAILIRQNGEKLPICESFLDLSEKEAYERIDDNRRDRLGDRYGARYERR